QHLATNLDQCAAAARRGAARPRLVSVACRGPVMRHPWFAATLALTPLVLLPGCGGTPPTKETPQVSVRGKLVHRGQPAPWVLVTFHAEDNPDQRYQGGTDKDGTFSLKCPSGRYRVALSPLPTSGAAPEGGLTATPDPKALKEIPFKYRKPGT